MRRWAWLLAAFLVAAGMTGGARAAAASERVRAGLVAETATASPGGSFWVALRLEIAEGWHTYWRNPGDSGEPTRIDWRLPEGVSASDIHWPAPEAIPYGPLVNFGYHGTAWHLVRITMPEDWPDDRPLTLGAEASWLVCKDICIPEGAELSLELAAATISMPPPALAAALAAARERLPAPFAGNASFAAERGGEGAPAGGRLILALTGADPSGDAKSAYFFPYAWGAIDPAAPQRLEQGPGGLRLVMAAGSEPTEGNLAGVVVFNPDRVADDPGRRAVAIEAAPGGGGATGAPPAGSGGSIAGTGASIAGAGAGPGLVVAIGLALLGGLILNVMPCVFPVLSIKAMSVLRHASDRSALRWSGLSYTAGVLVFVGLVAGALIALKAAGQEVGWGFQLQSPAFVAGMALLVFTLGLSLSGVFAIGGSMMGWGSDLADGRDGGSVRGSFFTGALAALVATPCTAPFMGVALGFALTQPWPMALAVFLALGLGLALPYLALTFLPGTARRLPRPGPWMERLKQALAFPLYLTAAWLVWVLALQAGAGAVLALLVAMVLAAFAAWLYDIAQGSSGGRRGLARALCLAAGVGALALALWPQTGAAPLPAAAAGSGGSAAQAVGRLAAEPFSFARLEELREDGTPVFVNLTAAWCITCQVNERLALSSPRVARAFTERGIVYLKGDWTNRDPEITRLLESFGRSGVPLYLFYGPGSDRPEILPQFLTESIVISAVEGLPVVAGNANQPKGSG